jgi:hypothetical protein
MPIVDIERIFMKIVKATVVLLLGMLLVTAFACGGGSEQEAAPAGWATYSNSSLGFNIQYPQDWKNWEGLVGDVTFVTPTTDASVPPAVIFVSVYEENLTLSQHVDECILAMKSSSLGYNIPESSETTVAGMPAHKFVVTCKSKDQSLMKQMDVHTIKNNTVYIITYMVFESDYPIYLDTAQHMIDSFVIY